MQKSIAQKALQCLCPHVNSIFSPAATHLPTKAARCFPEDCCQCCVVKGELMSRHCRVHAERLSLFRNHGLFPQIFTHICTYSPMHIMLKEQLLQGEPTLQTEASCLLPPAYTFCPPPSVRCTKFQGRPKSPIHLDLSKN